MGASVVGSSLRRWGVRNVRFVQATSCRNAHKREHFEQNDAIAKVGGVGHWPREVEGGEE